MYSKHSIIPMNPEYERKIFSRNNIDFECDTIWHLMLNEEEKIKKLIETGNIQTAALLYMQLAKSLCIHFVDDEHYNYFDDMYNPDYVLTSLTEKFNKLNLSGGLQKSTKTFLRKAWKEIQETEAFCNYGVPSCVLKM